MSLELLKENEVLKKISYPMWIAVNHHRTHNFKPLTFNRYYYLVDVYLDSSDYMVVMKSTQCGLSEYLIVRTIASSAIGRNVFYVLPSYDLVGRFVGNRVNRAISIVPYYQELMKAKDVARATGALLKHVGRGAISFVGSHSAAPFTEFPADDLVVDELDQCNEENLHMAVERLSNSEHRRICRVSNPTITDWGIHFEYKKTDQKKWFVKCSNCGKWIHPNFFDHVVKEVEPEIYVIIDKEWSKGDGRDIYSVCDKCGKPFNRYSDGVWVAQNKSDISGYHMSKMFTANVSICEMVDRFTEGMANPFVLQRFYNGDIGLPYTQKGAKVNRDDILKNVRDYKIIAKCENTCVMGIDVGTVCHCVIADISGEKPKVVYIGEVRDYSDIVSLYKRYNVIAGVIDAMPEGRFSRRVVSNLQGMFMCYYGSERRDSIDLSAKIITTDRTNSLDAVKEIIVLGGVDLPSQTAFIDGFMDQMTVSTRVYNENRDKYEWKEGSKPDHYFHAFGYMLTARRLMLSMR